MNTTKKVLRNAFLLISSGFSTQLIAFLTMIYLAKVLGPDGFGKLNFAVALTAHFLLLTNFGLTRQGIKEVAKRPEVIGEYTFNIVAMRVCLALASVLALFLLTHFLDKPPDVKNLIFLFGIGLIPGVFMVDWAFQGAERMEFMALGRILYVLLYAISLFYFVRSAANLPFVPCLQAGATLIAALVLLAFFLKHHPRFSFRADLTLWKKLFRITWPLGLSMLLVQMINCIDVVILGFFRNDAEIGYYSAAYKVIFVCSAMIANFFESVFPMLSTTYRSDAGRFALIQETNLKLMFAVGIPLLVGGTVLSREIVLAVFGPTYSESALIFRLLLWIPPIIYVNTVYAWSLLAMDMHGAYLRVVSLQVVVNVLFNFLLVPPFGVYGAGTATILSELIGLPFYYIACNNHFRLPIRLQYIFKPLVCALAMAATLYGLIQVLAFNVFILILLSCIAYISMMLLTKGITRDEVAVYSRP
jgi:O-antigen/teichoic acid export membrane protein